jgi:hypothetical protein
MDTAGAVAFLQKHPAADGSSLYEHLLRVLTKVGHGLGVCKWHVQLATHLSGVSPAFRCWRRSPQTV